MLFRSKPREDERWYLLPAMQHGARRKFYQRLTVAIVVGLITAAGVSAVIYFSNQP